VQVFDRGWKIERYSGDPLPERLPHALDGILESLGLSLAGIGFVIHSHGHGDSFPNACYVLHKKEYSMNLLHIRVVRGNYF
jgi:hypothetical protein